MLRGTVYLYLNDLKLALLGLPTVTDTYNKLVKMSKQPPEEIKKVTFNKIKDILRYSESNIPYYRDLFRGKKVDLSEINTYHDLEKIPILTKKDIRMNFPDRITSKNRKSQGIYTTTSGSAGEPLEFFRDYTCSPYFLSSTMFYNNLMGLDNYAVHWNLKVIGQYTWKTKLIYWFVGKHCYSIKDVKKENLPEIISQIDLIRPDYLEVYSASCEKLARFLDQENMKPKHSPIATIATAEALTEAGRALIEKVFRSEVFDRYGHLEFSAAVAQECREHNGFHINPLLTYIEVVDEEGNQVDEGEEGRILVTDLNNRVMPFIRYDVGDLGVRGGYGCPCGLHFPILKSLKGRTGEFIELSNGEKLPFLVLNGAMRKEAPYVFTFQFTQHSYHNISLKIVPTSKYNPEKQKNIHETISSFLPGFNVEIIIVDDIPPEASGKTPFLKKIIN